MKTDRSIKLMLGIIVVLLLLNLIKPGGPNGTTGFFETKVEATGPAFLKVGRSYKCFYASNSQEQLKILQVDPNSGWVQSDTQFGKFWFNTNFFASCVE